jgi:hypothetical protein
MMEDEDMIEGSMIEGDRKGRPYIFPPPPGAINHAATTPYQRLRRKAGMSMPLPRLNYKA